MALPPEHNVAHVFNAWTRMPALDEQAQLPDAYTADFTVVRALLRKGRTYEQAVKAFEPYDRVQEPNDGAREGMREIAERDAEAERHGIRVRQQPAGRQCADDHRGGGGGDRGA